MPINKSDENEATPVSDENTGPRDLTDSAKARADYDVHKGVRYLKNSMVRAPLTDGLVKCLTVQGKLHEIIREDFDKQRESCIWALDEHGFSIKHFANSKAVGEILEGIPVRRLLPKEQERLDARKFS